MQTPVRSTSRKNCISPLKFAKITNFTRFSQSSFEESSPSTLKNSEGSPKIKVPKIPDSSKIPNFLQPLNEKFPEKPAFRKQKMDSFESYCQRAMMSGQNQEEDWDEDDKTHIRELVRKQNKSFTTEEKSSASKGQQ